MIEAKGKGEHARRYGGQIGGAFQLSDDLVKTLWRGFGYNAKKTTEVLKKLFGTENVPYIDFRTRELFKGTLKGSSNPRMKLELKPGSRKGSFSGQFKRNRNQRSVEPNRKSYRR